MSCSLNPCQFSAYDFLSCPTKNSLAFNPPVCVDCVSTLHWQHRLSQFSSIQSLSCVRLFATPWTAAHQASLSTTNSWSLLKLMSIKLVMLSNHLIFCCPLLLPSIFPRSGSFLMNQFFALGGQSIRASASASVLPMNIQD